MVVSELTVSLFVFVDVEDCSVHKFLLKIPLVPHGLEQTCKLVVNRLPFVLNSSAGMAVSFPTGHLCTASED